MYTGLGAPSTSKPVPKLRLPQPHAGQMRVRREAKRFNAISGGRRWRKALALDTPLPTPDGWTTVGAVVPGDTLFDENGKPCLVTYVTETFTDRECYEVEFSDGTVIVADAGHLWSVRLGWRFPPLIVETEALFTRPDYDFYVDETRYIKDIRPTDSVPVKCVAVDSPSHLFLCGLTSIPTHNTTLCLSIAVESAAAGNTVLWGAPVYDQVRVGFLEARKAIGRVGVENVTHMEITFPMSGGRIIFRSLDDPNNVRGHTAHGVVIDEASYVNAAAWHEALRPMLMDTLGWAWLIGTPFGRNWFFKEWNAFRDHPDGMAWQIPSLGCAIEDGQLIRVPHPYENPHLQWSEIQDLFQRQPIDTFRAETLAEFLEGEGQVFRNIQPCLLNEQVGSPALHHGHSKVMGVDWGQKRDFTVMSVLCETCRMELELARYNRMEWEFLRAQVVRLMQKWAVRDILVELNSIGSPNFEALAAEGLPVRPFMTTSTSKGPLIQNLKLALEQESWYWLNQPWATAELEAYMSKVNTVTGKITYYANSEMHDDSVMARCIALFAASTPRVIHFS